MTQLSGNVTRGLMKRSVRVLNNIHKFLDECIEEDPLLIKRYEHFKEVIDELQLDLSEHVLKEFTSKRINGMVTGIFNTREELIDSICFDYHCTSRNMAQIAKTYKVSTGTVSKLYEANIFKWQRKNKKRIAENITRKQGTGRRK